MWSIAAFSQKAPRCLKRSIRKSDLHPHTRYLKASFRGAYGHDPFWSVFEEHRLDSATTDITTALFTLYIMSLYYLILWNQVDILQKHFKKDHVHMRLWTRFYGIWWKYHTSPPMLQCIHFNNLCYYDHKFCNDYNIIQGSTRMGTKCYLNPPPPS